MKLMRILMAALLIAALLATLMMTAYAEGNGYGRFNNPGQGHDWNPETKRNRNANDNTQHNENGYLNHMPNETDPGEVT